MFIRPLTLFMLPSRISFSYRFLLIAVVLVACVAAAFVLFSYVPENRLPAVPLPTTIPPQTPPLFPENVPSTVGTFPSVHPPTPTESFSARWLAPDAPLTISRGNVIHLIWETSGNVPANARIYFSLSGPGVQTQIESFLASAGQADFPVRVPPGDYMLTLTFPATVSNTINVKVTGPSPVISSQDSRIMFDDPDQATGTIIADGYCTIRVSAQIVDVYGYGIAGKKVVLRSSRNTKDIINNTLATTALNGRIQFLITSKTPGTSLLSARAEHTDLTNTLTLRVRDAQNFSCPQE